MSRTKKISIAVLVAVLLFFVASFFLDRAMMGQTFNRVPAPRVSTIATFEDLYAADHSRESVEFSMDTGTLRGFIYGQENTGKGLIVFRHGIFSQHQDYLGIIEALVDKGWRVFAYDAIGCGLSDGDSTIGFPQSPIDVKAALDFVDNSGMAEGMPVVLVGHSWGGYGVAAALNFDSQAVACVTMSGFASPMGIFLDTTARSFGPFAYTQVPTMWLSSVLDYGGNANLSAVDGINKAQIPVLVIHGTEDAVVGFDTSSIIAQRDRITNPQVEYLVCDAPDRNGHNTYFNAPEAQDYLNQISQEYEQLETQYEGDIPDAVLEEYLASVDIARANVTDPELVDAIDTFLLDACQRG